MTDLLEKKRRRLEFMQVMYDVTDGNQSRPIRYNAMAEKLAISMEDVDLTASYLAGEGLIKNSRYGGGDGIAFITHRGVVEVERWSDDPETPTEHFPSITTINIGTMTQSQVQAGNVGSAQTQQLNVNDYASLLDALRAFRESSESIPWPDESTRERARTSTALLETELSLQEPDHAVLASVGRSLRTILEGAAGNVLASTPAAQELLTRLQAMF